MIRFQETFKASILLFLLSLTSIVKAAETPDAIYGDSLQISLLTCGPGKEVYSLYGHTAIRFHDVRNQQDLVINYGMFSFAQKNFILRFIFGLTDYEMGIIPFDAFMKEYKREHRWVIEQVLNLSSADKRSIAMAIDANYLPENRVYRYNYFYDNCTTRARDLLANNIQGTVVYKSTPNTQTTFRSEIHQWNRQQLWARFGNDLLLGIGADQNLTPEAQQFLPDSLRKDFQTAIIRYQNGKERPLVAATHALYWPQEKTVAFSLTSFLCSPFALIALLLFIIMGAWYERKKHPKACFVVFQAVRLLTGLCGILLTMMLFSQHPTVRFNLQILFLNPLNLLFFVPKLRQSKRFNQVMAGCYVLACVGALFQTYAENVFLVAFILLFIQVATMKESNIIPRTQHGQ